MSFGSAFIALGFRPPPPSYFKGSVLNHDAEIAFFKNLSKPLFYIPLKDNIPLRVQFHWLEDLI